MFHFEAHGTECGKLLGGGAVVDIRPDHSRVDHEVIHARLLKEWGRHHPHCEVHIEEISSEQYGPYYVGVPRYNTTD